jgi:hypothetical protein
MEIQVIVDKNNKVISISGFEEKINSLEYFYPEVTLEDYEKYISNMFNLYYENNKFIEKEPDVYLINNMIKKEEKQNKIQELKNNLLNTDYQIIKCYEAFMRQQPLPYNLEELSAQRDAWREEINELEQELAELE